jgi:hypothetical protein
VQQNILLGSQGEYLSCPHNSSMSAV